MRFTRVLLPCLAACGSTASPYPGDVTALTGVEVLTMGEAEPVLHARTIVIDHGSILDIADASAVLPATATVIDATGKFVMPGLIDAHTHLWYEGELTLLVANGVTATRNMFGDPLQRDLRDEIASGARFGPTLVTAGPIVDGAQPLWPTSDVVVTDADAARVVTNQQAERYDLIKVYNKLSRPAWNAVMAQAALAGMPVGGHVPWAVGWDDVVASAQHTMEHLDGLIDVVSATQSPVGYYDAPAMNAAIDAIDDGRLAAAADRAASDGVILVPTLVVIDRFGTAAETAAWAADPIMRYVHPDLAAQWRAQPALAPDVVAALDRYTLALEHFTLALKRRGAHIALGTDANNAYVVPGFSVHDELALLVAAGLTDDEALRAATVEAAAAIGRADIGTIAIGQRADLLVLDADPSQDVSNARKRMGVMLGGQWHPEAELEDRLETLAAEYAQLAASPRQAPRFTGD